MASEPEFVEGKRKPAERKHRKGSSRAKVALALVETHLSGVYSQMTLLREAIKELKEALS